MPITPVEVMLGKIIPMCWWAFASNHHYRHRVLPVSGAYSWQSHLLAVLSTLFIGANLSIGYTFSTIAQNQLQAMQMSMMFFLPNILLSGFMFPFAGMPSGRNGSGGAAPHALHPHCPRDHAERRFAANLQYDAIALCVLMLIAMTIAVTRFRRTLD
jgi:ABC-2 type transport system permease protein